jgi:hypothetical protein
MADTYSTFLVLAKLTAALVGATGAAPDKAQAPPAARAVEFGLSYPPLKDAEQMAFTAQHLEQLNVKRIRFDEAWPEREAKKGRFDWSALDRRLAFAEEREIGVLLTVRADCPEWAAGPVRNDISCVCRDLQDFRNYAEALVRRCAGKLDSIQFGNEWQSAYWYAGTAEDYVRFNNALFAVVREHAPETKFVLGGFSAGSLRALAAIQGRINYYHDEQGRRIEGEALENARQSLRATSLRERVEFVLANASYDVVDLHLYDDVENWATYVAMIKELAPGKPIVVSEFGGPNLLLEPDDPEYQAAQLQRYLETLSRLDIRQALFFKLVASAGMTRAHRTSSLMDSDLRPKPAYEIFRSFNAASSDISSR